MSTERLIPQARILLARLWEEERRAIEVTKRVLVGVWSDGFIHAGNLAYLSMLALFPFFIIVGTLAGIFGRSGDGLRAVRGFLRTVPPSVADLLAEPIAAVIRQSSTGLITLSVLVGLWTTASYIETIRDILRRAYRARSGGSIWRKRLGSFALILGSVILMIVAFATQVILVGAEQFIERIIPWADEMSGIVNMSRYGPMLALFIALYVLYATLTPPKYRRKGCPKWPGAIATSAVWVGATMTLPWVLSHYGNYDRFYGPLAGVMITLLFFFIVGLGFVIGAELNAALAQTGENGQKDAKSADEPEGMECQD